MLGMLHMESLYLICVILCSYTYIDVCDFENSATLRWCRNTTTVPMNIVSFTNTTMASNVILPISDPTMNTADSLPEGATGGDVRVRSYSDKGLEYQIDLKQQNLRSKITAWRRRATRIERLLSESKDINALKGESGFLNREMNDVNEAYETLNELLTLGSRNGEESQRYESIEGQNYQLLRRITECINEMEGSEIRSRVSGRSNRSHHSSHRSRSSQLSTASKRADAAAQAAALRAKLKYIDTEARQTAELEKLKTMKEIDMAQAKVDAILKVEQDLNTSFDIEDKSLLSDTKQKFVEDYVLAQSSVQVPVTSYSQTAEISKEPASVEIKMSTFQPTLLQSEPVPQSTDMFKPSRTLDPYVNEFVPKSKTTFAGQLSGLNTQSTWVYPAGIPVVTTMQNSQQSKPVGMSAEQQLLNLATSFAEQVNLNRLPPPEPSVFDGNPLKYPGWKSAFQTLIDQKGIPSSEQIHYLKKYLSGPAREAIEGYFLLATEDAYEDAKRLLDQRYGDPFVVANAFRDRLDSWPKIPSRDGEALRKFSDFLRQCETAMQITGSLSILNDSRENRKILAKLPDWLVSRWGRIAAASKENGRGFPPFSEFRAFMVNESNIACDPVTSLQSLKGNQQDESIKKGKSDQSKKTYGVSAFATETNEGSRQNFQKVNPNCIYCHKEHPLDECKVFLSRPVSEIKAFIMEKGLCFGCLKRGHRSFTCRSKCKTCQESHPTVLHGNLYMFKNEVPKTETAKTIQSGQDQNSTIPKSVSNISVCHLSGTSEICKSSLILPVWISHRDAPNHEMLIYAMLDTQSDTTFILDRTSDELNIEGSDSMLLLSTMASKNKRISCKRFEGLMVRGFDNSQKIPLPITFSRNMIPSNRAHIPNPDMARKWPHLEEIADRLMPLSTCEVGLLIGYNCPRALFPREVIAPVNDGPYAQRTDLGWGIVGIVDSKQCNESDCDPIGISHRVLACEVQAPVTFDKNWCRDQDMTYDKYWCLSEQELFNESDLKSLKYLEQESVQFCLNTSTREVSPSEIVRLFEMDFIEKGPNEVTYSQDDLQFLSILRDGIHQKENGHYEMPLPFKSSEFILPNNKILALG